MPISQEAVNQSIAQICTPGNYANNIQSECGVRLKPVEDWNVTLRRDGLTKENAEEYLRSRTPWHFLLQIENGENDLLGIVSFNVAYSSWSGRILYVDRIIFPEMESESEVSILQILADIAQELKCVRLTWRHIQIPKWHLLGTNRPEMHGDVLTLSMNKDALEGFIQDSPLDKLETIDGTFSEELVKKGIASTLLKLNSIPQGQFRLRLAGPHDLKAVERLVKGLAEYVKEPDSVKMSAEDYFEDGFGIENPLWYCILVERSTDDSEYHSCGFAFMFMGYTLGQGRFVYLEDLYIEVEHRGHGAGKLAMKALAGICMATQCSKLLWQALDWNIASLDFYKKIGAKVHDGEKTSRYAGGALKKFGMSGTS